MNRGDVVLAFYPFASGSGGKRRPGIVVQNDADKVRIAATILAQITTNLARAGEPTHLLIEASTTGAIAPMPPIMRPHWTFFSRITLSLDVRQDSQLHRA